MSDLILHIETSAKHCTVALGLDGNCICSRESSGEWRHSKEITLLIQALLSDNQLKMTDLASVAISAGPGSYTGLRVGASCAKGICYALNIPLIAVETLEIIAYECHNQLAEKETNFIIPTIDARRDEVYYRVYDQNLSPITDVDNHILLEKSFSDYPNAIICGDGADKASKILTSKDISFYPSFPQASYMIPLAFRQYKAEKFENLAYYNPFYLKMPNITKSKKGIPGIL